MESEVLSEKIEWEARRIAMVFNAVINKHVLYGSKVTFHAHAEGRPLIWQFDEQEELRYFSIDGRGETGWALRREESYLSPDRGEWIVLPDARYSEIVARGLYQIGFEEESVLVQLPQLTSHEKLELRLSLPREFWPQKWLNA